MDEAANACHLPNFEYAVPPYIGILVQCPKKPNVSGGSGHRWTQVLRWLEKQSKETPFQKVTVFLTSAPRQAPRSLAGLLANLGVAGLVVGRDLESSTDGWMAELKQKGISVRKYRSNYPYRRLNQRFLEVMDSNRAWVLLKSASSLDGRIATRTQESQWITSKEARALGRSWRGQVDGICVGVETVLSDNPRLTTRITTEADPTRIVFDSRLRTPPDAEVITTASQVRTIIVTTRRSSKATRDHFASLGVDIVLTRSRRGRVDLAQALEKLWELGIRTLMVEGGAALHGSFVDARMVDRVAAFIAPIIIGGQDAKTGIGGRGVAQLSEALTLAPFNASPVGSDLLVLADVQDKA